MADTLHHLRNRSCTKIGMLRSELKEEKVTPLVSDNRIDSTPTAIVGLVGGPRLTRGKTLANEIDWYKHRVEALMHFLDRMAPQWWDHMYPFGEEGKLVRRPSRTADKIRATHDRLVARLARLTPRVIVLATNAVIAIEEAEAVSILPLSLIHTRPATRPVGAPHVIAAEKQLAVIFTFVRRLSEIERLKQQIILHTMDWIKADGNNLQVRAQRLERLAHHIQPCLIENHEGVSALIRHYFRRRSNPKGDERTRQILDSSDDAKMQLKYAFSAITADNIYSTNRLIMELIKANRVEGTSTEAFSREAAKSKERSSQKPFFENLIGRSVKEVYEWARRFTSDDASPTTNASNAPTGWMKVGKIGLLGETIEPERMKYDICDVSEEDQEAWREKEELNLAEIRRRVFADLSRRESEANLMGAVGAVEQQYPHSPILVKVGVSGNAKHNTEEKHRLSRSRSDRAPRNGASETVVK